MNSKREACIYQEKTFKVYLLTLVLPFYAHDLYSLGLEDIAHCRWFTKHHAQGHTGCTYTSRLLVMVKRGGKVVATIISATVQDFLQLYNQMSETRGNLKEVKVTDG